MMLHAKSGGRRAVLAVLVVLCACRSAAAAPADAAAVAVEAPAATLDRSSLPAKGRQAALLSVQRFGRYAVTVKSSQGVALQLVDRVAGPSAVSGEPGVVDGRVEGFLDHGEYRVVALAADEGTGSATLEAHAFRELSLPKPAMLGLLGSVDATLGDFEQRSWWLHVPGRQRVAIEAAGRALSDLRLWQDGQWLVDAEPSRDLLEPETGRPLTVLRLVAMMEPGVYLLTAYGGVPQAWSNDDGASPLLLRLGTTELAEAGRQRRVMSAFGIDRFIVPGVASFFRLELDESPASLGAGTLEDAFPFARPQDVASITKETLPPAVELRRSSSPGAKTLVTVTAPPGKAYILQHFDARERQYYKHEGRRWVSTVHSGAPSDSIDATVIVTSTEPRPDGRVVPIGASGIELGTDAAWARRFNLLETATLFLHVREAGEYEVEIAGVEARCRIEPYLLDPPENYEAPKLRGSGSDWDLEQGWHVLTLEPETIGIAEVAVRRAGLWAAILGFIGREKEAGLPPLQPSVRFPESRFTRPWSYVYHLNRQPGVAAGLVARELPIDASKALPISLAEGDSVTVPVRVGEASILRAEVEDGSLMPISLDGGEPQPQFELAAGVEHRVTLVALPSGGPRVLSLAATPLRETRPLPDLPADLEPKPLDLPVLVAGKPQFFDLDRDETRTFLVRAAEGGLYRLETTGLLATEGNLRNRVVTSLARSSDGGTGRNFLVQQAVQSGDYQLSVKALGRSKGHVGLSLARTRIGSGGTLESGVQENATLPSGQGIAYDLVVTDPSTWRVRAFALGRTLRCRFEEEGGWPLEIPGGEADISRRLEPGRYRFIVLPEPTEARIAVMAERATDAVKRVGHGPFALELDEVGEAVWLESPEGAERVPDRWTFTMPATSEATITLGNGMEARVSRGSDEVALVKPGRPWTGMLPTGAYAIDVTAPRRDNRRSYTVQVRPKALMAGMTRTISVPAELEIAAEPGGTVEISSNGSDDVRARLLDETGRVVASSDDATDDWNFRMGAAAWQGMRRLHVEPVGAGSGTTTVSVAQEQPADLGEIAPGETRVLDLASGEAARLLVGLPSGRGLLLVAADADHPTRLLLEGMEPAAACSSDPVLASDRGRRALVGAPVGEDRACFARLRLTVAAEAGRRSRVALTVRLVSDAPTTRLAAVHPPMKSGTPTEVRLAPVDGIERIHVARIDVEATHVDLDLSGGERAWHASLASGSWSELAATDTDAVPIPSGWVVARSATRSGPVLRATPVLVDLVRDGLLVKSDSAPLRVLPVPTGGLAIVFARSEAGTPTFDRPAATWSGGSATILRGGQVPSLGVRLTSPSASRRGPMRISEVVIDRIERGESQGSAWSSEFALPRDASTARARQYALPDGFHEIRIVLGAGTLALLSSGTQADAIVGSPDHATDQTLGTMADSLVIVALPSSVGAHSIAVSSGEREDFRLLDAQPWEAILPHAGTRHFHGAESPGRLRVRGSEPAWFDVPRRGLEHLTEGLVASGEAVILAHGTGPVACWMEPEGRADGAWGSSTSSVTERVASPARVALAGAVRTLRIDSAPALLSLRTSHPVVVRLRRDGQEPEADAWPAGARLAAWLPTGKAEIDLRGFASEQLAGTASVAMAPAEVLHEGVGAETLVPAGDARAYTFTLAAPATVGIGMRAGGAVDVELLDAATGEPLGSGIVQMPKLEAGSYVLVVRASAAGPPVSVRPALLGVESPGLGPPEEIVRAFVEGREVAPAAAAPIPPGWERWLAVATGSGEEQGYQGDGDDSGGEGD